MTVQHLRRAAAIVRAGHHRDAPAELADLLEQIARDYWPEPRKVTDAANALASALTTQPEGEPLDPFHIAESGDGRQIVATAKKRSK